jgi:hypothetical protein
MHYSICSRQRLQNLTLWLAMPFAKKELAKLGGTESHKGAFRAHIQLRNETDGQYIHICGPSRPATEEAHRDLDQIRAAGVVGRTREEGVKIMEAEAQRIKISAEYQTQIQETLQRRITAESIHESDYEDDDTRSEQSDPPWMKEYPNEDPPEDSSQPVRPTLTPLEATAELTRFRPILAKPSDLKHLLECKADPNMPITKGDITPLRKVMSFASERYVTEMRDLLLQYGANESDKDRARWELRKSADLAEKSMKSNCNNIIDKDYNPWSGNVEF